MSTSRFVSLGGVWLDDIQVGDRVTQTRVPGGSVTFATLGARLFSAEDPSSVSFVLRAGSGFPEHVLWSLRKWKTNLRVEWAEHLPAARGLLQYDEHDASKRTYQRLTDPLLTSTDHLTISEILHASCFHFFDTPKTMKEEIKKIFLFRSMFDAHQQVYMIWEPQAKSCTPEMLEAHLCAVNYVDVFSPNHIELESLFSDTPPTRFSRKRIEGRARHFLDRGIGAKGTGGIVVRAAEHGCLVMRRKMKSLWLPAFYGPGSSKVVDTTGAGNAFLGGFAIGMVETQDYVSATGYGQVAASFAIEQVGLPSVTVEGRNELWNGDDVDDRLDEYSCAISDLMKKYHGRNKVRVRGASEAKSAGSAGSSSKRRRLEHGTH